MSRFNSSIVVFRGSSSTSIYIDYEDEERMLTTLLFPRGSLWKGGCCNYGEISGLWKRSAM